MTVSIIIPSFNAGSYLKPCISSCLNQKADHILIIDDGSTDDSLACIRSMTAYDSRIRYRTHKENRGAVETRNELTDWALELGSDWINHCDADDFLFPRKIQRQIEAWDGEEILWCDFMVYDYTYSPPLPQQWRMINPMDSILPPLPPSLLLHRSFFGRGIRWREEFNHGFNDLAFWLDILRGEVKRKRTPFFGFLHRRNWSSSSITNRKGRSRSLISKKYREFEGIPLSSESRYPNVKLGNRKVVRMPTPFTNSAPSGASGPKFINPIPQIYTELLLDEGLVRVDIDLTDHVVKSLAHRFVTNSISYFPLHTSMYFLWPWGDSKEIFGTLTESDINFIHQTEVFFEDYGVYVGSP